MENNYFSALFYTPQTNASEARILFFHKPKTVLHFSDYEEPKHFFEQIDEKLKGGDTAICLLPYELGYLFEPNLWNLIKSDKRFTSEIEKTTFYFFESLEVKTLSIQQLFDQAEKKQFQIFNFRPLTKKTEYLNNVEKIRHYIREGDTYQVNYTFQCSFDFSGSVEALFSSLLFNQSASYAAFIDMEDRCILSISPELFFHIEEGKIFASPMKGTIKRGKTIQEDDIFKNTLFQSQKDRAENVMILDLLRNDLGKVSNFGSVTPFDQWKIEKYESVFQMTSSVKAALRKDITLSEVLKELFPCGSITGAPKIRTMEIIHQLEKMPRGIYTGSIGMCRPDKSVLNVAIRTLEIDKQTNKGKIGIGSGIVWDSDPESEYEETLLKANFLTSPNPYFELIETMLCENKEIELLEFHLERLSESSEFFLFHYDQSEIRTKIREESAILDDNKWKIRLLLSKWGNVSITSNRIITKNEPVKVRIAEEKIDPKNRFQYHKTTNRDLYNKIMKDNAIKGYYDTIFLNTDGFVAEGAITNIFIEKDGTMVTPPIKAGILNGVYRRYILRKKPEIVEKDITLQDLLDAEKVFLTNAVKGIVQIDKIDI